MARKPLPPIPKDPFECLQQGCERPWEVEVEPFEVAPRTWFVGNNWVGAYLLETSDGLILIDTTMQPQVYLLTESIRMVGHDPRDIRLILLSHMHYDHCGGIRALQEHATEAKVVMSHEDWDFMQARPDQVFESGYPFGPFKPDLFYADDRPVTLGDRIVRTMLTPGHTPGTTSFFFDAADETGTWRCAMHGGVGLNTLGDEFLAEHGLPVSARDDFLASMLKVRDLPVDIALGSHPAQTGMMEKVDLIRPGHNPFIDPAVWTRLVDGRIAQVRALMADAA